MLNDLQRLFKDTWSAFRTELGRREPEDEVAELLGMMKKEMVSTRAVLPQLDETVVHTEKELQSERAILADCERRASMAERIGDQETVRVAREFTTRHRERVTVLEKKVAAVSAERDLLRREIEQMTQRYRYADNNRFALVAELRRRRAEGTIRNAMDGESGVFGDLARMEEAIEHSGATADALEELNDLERGSAPRGGDRSRDIDDRLAELKKRMKER